MMRKTPDKPKVVIMSIDLKEIRDKGFLYFSLQTNVQDTQ